MQCMQCIIVGFTHYSWTKPPPCCRQLCIYISSLIQLFLNLPRFSIISLLASWGIQWELGSILLLFYRYYALVFMRSCLQIKYPRFKTQQSLEFNSVLVAHYPSIYHRVSLILLRPIITLSVKLMHLEDSCIDWSIMLFSDQYIPLNTSFCCSAMD